MLSTILLISCYIFYYRGGLFFNSFNLDEVILTLCSFGLNVGEFSRSEIFEANLIDVWVGNRTYGSIDPGLFTIILHLWSKISTSTLWLRSLSMLFFALASFFLSLTLRSSQVKYTFFLSILLFSNSLLLDHAYTVRPYAMEIAGMVYLFYFLKSYSEGKRNLKLILGLSFFIGSRYYFWINTTMAIASIAGLSVFESQKKS